MSGNSEKSAGGEPPAKVLQDGLIAELAQLTAGG